MREVPKSAAAAAFIDAPRDAALSTLYDYRPKKRGSHLKPADDDIDPAEFRQLLPHAMSVAAFILSNISSANAAERMLPR